VRNSIKLFSIVVKLSLIVYVSVSHAEGINILSEGAELETTQNVKVRSTPPEQKWFVFIKKPGKTTGSLPVGEKIKIKEVKTVSSPLSKDVWIKVLSEKNIKGESLSGWVYFGDEKMSKNFKVSNDK